MSLLCYLLFLLYKQQCFGQPCAHLQELTTAQCYRHDLVLCRSCRKAIRTGQQVECPLRSSLLRTPQWILYLLTGSDSLTAATAQHQHVAITLRSRQLLKMGTWLSETCWATCKVEIKDNTKVTSSWFLIHTELRCTANQTSDLLSSLIDLTFCGPCIVIF